MEGDQHPPDLVVIVTDNLNTVGALTSKCRCLWIFV